jgi:hypothetical protein
MIKSITRFLGIDARTPGAAKFGAMADALNVSIATGGGLARRPALHFERTVPAASKGLFSVGDQVCVAAPTGTDISALAPDFNAFLLSGGGALVRIHGVVVDSLGKPLLLVEVTGGGAELHLAQAMNATPAGNTLLVPGFTPLLGGLVKVGARAWCLEDAATYRALRWSAIDDRAFPGSLAIWSPAADPVNEARRGNFLDLGQHTAAGGKPVGITAHNGRIAAFFPYAVQLWRAGSAETDRYLEQVVDGPGLLANRCATAVGSDTMFLGRALTIQSLEKSGLTEGAAASGPGAPVDAIVQHGLRINQTTSLPVYDSTVKPVVLHARARGEVLFCFGATVLVLGWTPGEPPRGWTRWVFPLAIDDLCEVGAIVHVRCGTSVYRLDDTQDAGDEVTAGVFTPIPVLGDILPLKVGPNLATLARIFAISSEDLRVQAVRDGRPQRQNDGALGTLGTTVTLPGRSPTTASVLCGWPLKSVGVRFYDAAATASWRLDELGFEIESTRTHGSES